LNLASIGFVPNSPNFVDEGEPPCSEADPDSFFPQEQEFNGVLISSNYRDEKGAKAVCEGCPYKARCLQFAISQRGEVEGIWGGTTENERRLMRRRIARAKNRTPQKEVK
jgi:WhiB family redox-sensing transcriptional regulator